MVAKISLGKSLFGALAYNGEKIDKEQGKLLGTNKIFDGCSGRMDISRAMQDFSRYLSPHVRTEKPVMHVSLNPHPDDRLTDMELENIAREYMERMGFGEQPYIIYKHEDIDRHHLHIVTIRVDDNGRCISDRYNFRRSREITRELEHKYGLHPADSHQSRGRARARALHSGMQGARQWTLMIARARSNQSCAMKASPGHCRSGFRIIASCSMNGAHSTRKHSGKSS